LKYAFAILGVSVAADVGAASSKHEQISLGHANAKTPPRLEAAFC
jgi:hypothetical protein